jgi:hypothetical protein
VAMDMNRRNSSEISGLTTIAECETNQGSFLNSR